MERYYVHLIFNSKHYQVICQHVTSAHVEWMNVSVALFSSHLNFHESLTQLRWMTLHKCQSKRQINVCHSIAKRKCANRFFFPLAELWDCKGVVTGSIFTLFDSSRALFRGIRTVLIPKKGRNLNVACVEDQCAFYTFILKQNYSW